jgi:hypothetical protein
MKLPTVIVRTLLPILAVILTLAGSDVGAQTGADNVAATQGTAVPARVTQAIDETRTVRLRGNVHPLAKTRIRSRPSRRRGAHEPNVAGITNEPRTAGGASKTDARTAV